MILYLLKYIYSLFKHFNFISQSVPFSTKIIFDILYHSVTFIEKILSFMKDKYADIKLSFLKSFFGLFFREFCHFLFEILLHLTKKIIDLFFYVMSFVFEYILKSLPFFMSYILGLFKYIRQLILGVVVTLKNKLMISLIAVEKSKIKNGNDLLNN